MNSTGVSFSEFSVRYLRTTVLSQTMSEAKTMTCLVRGSASDSIEVIIDFWSFSASTDATKSFSISLAISLSFALSYSFISFDYFDQFGLGLRSSSIWLQGLKRMSRTWFLAKWYYTLALRDCGRMELMWQSWVSVSRLLAASLTSLSMAVLVRGRGTKGYYNSSMTIFQNWLTDSLRFYSFLLLSSLTWRRDSRSLSHVALGKARDLQRTRERQSSAALRCLPKKSLACLFSALKMGTVLSQRYSRSFRIQSSMLTSWCAIWWSSPLSDSIISSALAASSRHPPVDTASASQGSCLAMVTECMRRTVLEGLQRQWLLRRSLERVRRCCFLSEKGRRKREWRRRVGRRWRRGEARILSITKYNSGMGGGRWGGG